MNEYRFILRLVAQINNFNKADQAKCQDMFFEAGCDDAMLCVDFEGAYLEFYRPADKLSTAIETAVDCVNRVGFTCELKTVLGQQGGFENE